MQSRRFDTSSEGPLRRSCPVARYAVEATSTALIRNCRVSFPVSLAEHLLVCSAGRSSACAPLTRRCRAVAVCLFGLKPQKVARLASQRLADRLERREPNRARLAGLEDREV